VPAAPAAASVNGPEVPSSYSALGLHEMWKRSRASAKSRQPVKGQSSNPKTPHAEKSPRNDHVITRVERRAVVPVATLLWRFIGAKAIGPWWFNLSSRSTLMHENKKLLWPVVAGVAALAAFAVVVQFWDSPRFESWTREDGPVENLQALLYAFGGLFFLAVAFRHRRNPWAWLLAVGLLFCAGEEVSWGQRVFGFGTPSGLEGVNIQNEANLHNIENIHGNVRTYGFMALGALFVILPVIEAFSRSVRALRKRSRFLHVPLHVVPAAAAAFGFMSIPRYVDADAFGFDEVGELFTALAMCVYGSLHFVYLRRQQAASRDVQPAMPFS
jgi:hypothetical protein